MKKYNPSLRFFIPFFFLTIYLSFIPMLHPIPSSGKGTPRTYVGVGGLFFWIFGFSLGGFFRGEGGGGMDNPLKYRM